MAREIQRRRLAHFADAERVDEARQRRRATSIDRGAQVLRRLGSHPVERFERRDVERIDVGHVLDESALDQLIDQLVAEPFDVHRQPRREVADRFFALRRAIETAAAARHCFVVSAVDVRTAHRAARRHDDLGRVAGRFDATTLITCGITSPARRTITVSPIMRPRRAISSMLCSVALLTVTPPTNTGSRRATGVTAPVRPT